MLSARAGGETDVCDGARTATGAGSGSAAGGGGIPGGNTNGGTELGNDCSGGTVGGIRTVDCVVLLGGGCGGGGVGRGAGGGEGGEGRTSLSRSMPSGVTNRGGGIVSTGTVEVGRGGWRKRASSPNTSCLAQTTVGGGPRRTTAQDFRKGEEMRECGVCEGIWGQ